MEKLALHGQSYKRGQLGGLERHNLRQNQHYSNDKIKTEKTHENMTLVAPVGGLYYAAKRRIEQEVEPYMKKKLRSDANWMTEFVITMPPSVTDRDAVRKYCICVLRYFEEKVGAQNIISAVIHMDETTPHMHLDFIPIQEHRLSSKAVMTRSFLCMLHDELPKVLQKEGFAVERGESAKTLEEQQEKSRDLRTYKQEMEDKKNRLQRQITSLQKLREALRLNNYQLAKLVLDRYKSIQKNMQER